MSLPVKKIYIDSQYKIADSGSSSDFRIELPYTITMPHNAIFTIDEICIPHAWYSVEANLNDKIYIHLLDTITHNRYNVIATVPAGNYNGILFRAALQRALDLVAPAFTSFLVNYDASTYSITINVATSNLLFNVLSDVEIMNGLRGLWATGAIGPGGDINRSNVASINDILRNSDEQTTSYGFSIEYKSGFLNFQAINNMYLSSPNLGTFTTIGARGESTIIKKIPVSAEYGYMIIDRSTSVHDYLECGKCTLKTIEFHLKDSKGRFVPLHGCNISFSIVFAIKSED